MIIAIWIVIAITFPLPANNVSLQTNIFTLDKRNRDDWIRTSGPFVPNEVRYQAAPLTDGGASYCAALGASIPFCANPCDRLESRQQRKSLRCSISSRKKLQRFGLRGGCRCLTPVIRRLNAAVRRTVAQAAKNGIKQLDVTMRLANSLLCL